MTSLDTSLPATAWSRRLDLRLGTVLVAALVLRLAWAVLVPVQPLSDSVVYDQFARSIANGHGYAYPDGSLTVFWPVGTSAVYALLYRLIGEHWSVIAGFNVALGVALVGLTHALAKRYFDARTAIVAAWLTAAWPVLVQFTTVLASELLFTTLLLAALWVWGSQRGHWVARTVLWASLLCAASYMRPIAWPLLAVLPALDGLRQPHQLRLALATLAVASVSAALWFAPWMYRNHTLFGVPVLVSANGGSNLWMGNNPQATGAYMPMPPTPGMNEVQRDQHLGRLARNFIVENPLAYLKLGLRRLAITFSRETIGVVWNQTGLASRFGAASLPAFKLVSSLYWGLVLLAGSWGLWRLGQRQGLLRCARHPLVVVLVYLALIPILTVGQDRYHLPLDPLLAMLAAYAVAQGAKTASLREA